MGKKKELSEARKSLAKLKAQLRKVKMAENEIKAECFHRHEKKNKFYLRPKKKEKGLFQCCECGSKVDFRPFKGLSKQEGKKFVKRVLKDYINLIDVCKLLINKHNKKDEKYIKTLIVASKAAYRFKKMAIASIGDVFEPHRKNKKNKKGGKKNFNDKLVGGGRSFK